MGELIAQGQAIRSMSALDIENVRALETGLRDQPQIALKTSHIIHAGVYARTITIPAGALITGALVKRSTNLVVSGHCLVYIGKETVELKGYGVIAASRNRKQAFYALEETHLTMAFATNATSVEQAENEFTDEGHLLASRGSGHVNYTTITGE